MSQAVEYYQDGDYRDLILAWGSGCEVRRTISAKDAAQAEAFPLETMAALLNASVDELVKFAKDDGTAQCTGTTRTGRRCGNYVGHIQRPFGEWLEIERAGMTRCHQHREASGPAGKG